MSGEFDLTGAELDEGWARQRRVIDRIPASPAPEVVFLGAQPAAGKSRAQRLVQGWFTDPLFVVDSDELRALHPRFTEIMATDPVRMPVLVNQAASEWTRRSIDHALARGVSTLVENTFHNPETIADSAKAFRATGYRARAVVVAVPPQASRLSMVARYVANARAGDVARWTTLAAHDRAVGGVAATLERLHRDRGVEQVTVIDRHDRIGLDVVAGTPEWETADPAGELQRMRQAYWTPEALDGNRAAYLELAELAKTEGLVTESTRTVWAALATDAQYLAGAGLDRDPAHRWLAAATAELSCPGGFGHRI